MNKLINAKKNLRKNGKKGFTLVELIVVIVIIAILIAALTPAILGVIERARKSADEADARSIMLAAQVAADYTTTTPPLPAAIHKQFTGNLPAVTVDLYFDGVFCVGVKVTAGRSEAAKSGSIIVGDISGATYTKVEDYKPA